MCLPSIGSVAYQDTNSTTIALTGNNQDIVRSHSVVQFSASSLSAQKSATVVSCSVKVNGNTYNLTLSGSSATGGNATINSGMSLEAVFTVTDSRGLTATKSITVNMLDWYIPSAIISLHRQNNYYSETDFLVDADFASINGNNAVTITYTATENNPARTVISGTLTNNVTSVVTLDNEYEWSIAITITDSLGGTVTYNLILSRGMPIIYFDRSKSSVGVNCFPEGDKALEVSGYDVLDLNSFEIPANTDLDTLTRPKLYYGRVSDGITNSPLSGGSFTLAVTTIGDAGIMQFIIACQKVNPTMWVRHYYQNSWGNWNQMA